MRDERGHRGQEGEPDDAGAAGTGGAYRPGYEIAAERILEHVARMRLQPGDRVGTERDLAEALDISRAVTREAVKILSALGRLTVRKRSGVHVADPALHMAHESWSLFLPADPEQVRMLFELRRTLELATSELAASRATPPQVRAVREAAHRSSDAAEHDDFDSFRQADEDFHRAVAAASNNVFFESTVGVITQLKRQVLTIGLRGGQSGSLVVAAKQHVDIADAIADGDPGRAKEAMAEHIDVAIVQFRHEIQRRMLDVEPSPSGGPAESR